MKDWRNIIIALLSIIACASLVLNFRYANIGGMKMTDFRTVETVRVIDGDTFVTGGGETVRLYLINAPEYPKDCYSLQAKERLEKLILDKEVQITEIKKDNFGRTLAWISIDGLPINKALVEEGFAFAEMNAESVNYPELAAAETTAKQAQRGMWSGTCGDLGQGKCKIKGNYRKDNNTYIYHLPDCYNYEKIVIDTNNRDRWFCTEKEAMSAGFTKSKDCP